MTLIEITKEQLERLYKKQKNSLRSFIWICLTTSIVGMSVIMSRHIMEEYSDIILAIGIALTVIPFIISAVIRKKLIPEGNGRAVMEAYNYVKNDFMSDRAIDMIYRKMGEANNYADKTKLMLFLVDTYLFQGKINDAIGVLNSIDRTQFLHHPEIGMSFYNDTICVYSAIGDDASVLAAYKDAEPYIDECALRNYTCCTSALSILIPVEKARGNYEKALQLRLMKNEFENKFNGEVGSSQQYTPLAAFMRGGVFMETAELCYLNGDYANAGKYLDIGGPMLTPSPFYTDQANKLSAKIRDALNNTKG